MLRSKNFETYLIFFLGVLISLASWKGDFEGGDIAAARRSFLSKSPIDIWGAFSGFFYGHLPTYFFSWGIYLLMIHMIFASIGLIMIRRTFLKDLNRYSYKAFIFISYLILNFVSYLTRDSTMLTFFLFGLGLWFYGRENVNQKQVSVLRLWGYFFLLIACTFRPWISIAFAFLILGIKSNLGTKKIASQIIPILLIFMVTPFLLNNVGYFNTQLRHVHPELQVIAMDAGSLACLSNDMIDRNKGLQILNSLSSENRNISQVCGKYSPNTWESVAYWQLDSNELLALGIKNEVNNPNNLLTPLITNLKNKDYFTIRNRWINTIIHSPKSYLQIKMFQFEEVITAGDTFGFRISNYLITKDPINILKGIVLLPYDFVISIHLISPFFASIIGIFFLFRLFRNRVLKDLLVRLDVVSLFGFLYLWSTTTTIAFIGDNGRYVYASSLLFMLILLGIKPTTPVLQEFVDENEVF
jgi:hypothetical protein